MGVTRVSNRGLSLLRDYSYKDLLSLRREKDGEEEKNCLVKWTNPTLHAEEFLDIATTDGAHNLHIKY